MKLILGIVTMMIGVSAFAQDIGIKPGLYKITTKIYIDGKIYDPLAEMKKQLESIPEAMRAQVMQNMGGLNFDKPQEQCITKEDLTYENFAKSLELEKDCKSTITKKTKKEIHANMKCKDGTKYNMVTKILKPTHYLVNADGNISGKQNSKLNSEGVWVADKCVKKKNPGKKALTK